MSDSEYASWNRHYMFARDVLNLSRWSAEDFATKHYRGDA